MPSGGYATESCFNFSSNASNTLDRTKTDNSPILTQGVLYVMHAPKAQSWPASHPLAGSSEAASGTEQYGWYG